VAIEIASRRITVAQVGSGRQPVISGYATEPLEPGVVVPAPAGANVTQPAAAADALRRAIDRAGLGSIRRAALVVPDSVARVSMLNFEQMPPKAADLDQLIRWQLRKSTPYPIEEAQVSSFVAHRGQAGVTMAAAVARRDVVAQYEGVAAAAGIHAGLVDLASFNVMNAVISAGAAPAGDWLLVALAEEATTLAILRGSDLMFYRHRAAVEAEPLSALVHQTAMYHEDRLGGSRFERVWISGGALAEHNAEQARREIGERLGVPAESVDFRPAATLGERVSATADVLDALAAPVGVLLRERVAA